MPISQRGDINTTALVIPDIYVQVVPPATLSLNGVPTNTAGVVGTASWGPVGEPVIVGSMADYARAFGPIRARLHDAGTIVATAVLQGANAFRVVRASDGTEAKATGAGPTGCIEFEALYAGTVGNDISVRLAPGSRSGTWRLIVGLPGLTPEVFDGITGSGNAFWHAAAAAINAGLGLARGASALVRATAGAGTTAPAAATWTLSGGTDGAGVDSDDLLGEDGVTRSGLYALRGQGCSLVAVADLFDPTTWAAQIAFAKSETTYAMLVGEPGQAIADAIGDKDSAAVDDWHAKVLFGDWLYWRDPVNGLRVVSPQGFEMGRLANLSPEQSSLNKPIYGIVGSQRTGLPGSGANRTYSSAEMQALFEKGIELITSPSPGGNYWAARLGHNASLDASVSGDNYTRLTHYLTRTFEAGMGRFVGRVINEDTFRDVRATLDAFLAGLEQQGILGSTDGQRPFVVKCDVGNNPQIRTALGYLQADVQVTYQAINEKFLVNLEGGQSVTVTRLNG